ncbi:hypothetical protein ACFPOE_11520 [Caenimonas terrae]|uniref:Uncharacterized protein n=1 Tax=Caenimonas terrae TaxID=696074 RepID=A0ABW0NBY4_9BURK
MATALATSQLNIAASALTAYQLSEAMRLAGAGVNDSTMVGAILVAMAINLNTLSIAQKKPVG